MGDDPDRRKFLKVATCALGGGAGLVIAAPVIHLVMDPAGKQTVTSPTEPLDIGPVTQFKAGEPPRRVEIVAPVVQDAWAAARDVVLGAAWIRRVGTTIDARSAMCPHLGCAVGWDASQKNYLCACHNSRFDVDGGKLTGPSKRGLDPLPVKEVDGRLKLTWVLYKLDTKNVEPA